MDNVFQTFSNLLVVSGIVDFLIVKLLYFEGEMKFFWMKLNSVLMNLKIFRTLICALIYFEI